MSGGNAGQNSGGASGGSAASGGGEQSRGGEAQVPPVKLPPVSCAQLGSKVGVWENVSPEQLANPRNMEAFSVVVNHADGTVYAAGSNRTNGGACPECPVNNTGVLRSSDCGATFERVNGDEEGTPGANLNTGALWAMLVHPTQPQIIYAANGYGADPTLYKTTDGGVTWTMLNAGVGFVQSAAIDRNDGAHLAVTFHDDCKPPRNRWCFSTTFDGGATWTLFDGPTSIPGWEIGGWVEGASISILGKNAYLVASVAGVWYSGDTGASWKQVAAEALYLSYNGASVIARGNLFVAGDGHMLISRAAPGMDPPFELAKGDSLQVLPGSPFVTTFVAAGDLVFAGTGRDDKQPLFVTAANDPTGWQRMTQDICAPNGVCRGPAGLAYDPVHEVIYAANWGAGLWRYVIK